MRTRENTFIRLVVAAGTGSVVVLLAGVILLFATQHRVAATAPDYRVVAIGGIEYEAMLGRPIDPRNKVDHKIVAGLPGGDTSLFGAFISATNTSAGPRTTADRIELRDEAGHVYRPLPLPATNPYAYSQRLLRPGVRIPAVGTPADDNLAAGGRLLLFRIPARVSGSEVLELVIHDPSRPARTASLII